MTTMTQRLKAGLYVAIVVLAANAIRLSVAPHVQAQSVSTTVPDGTTIVPFTVALTETVLSSTGKKIPAPAQTIAVRSDGARVTKIGDGPGSTRIIQFPSGLEVEVSDALRGKSSLQRPPTDLSWLLDPKANCAKAILGTVVYEGQTAEENFRGYRAARIESDNRTRWFALDFGCAPLGRFTDSGAQGTSTLELVSLIPGEPSQSLFDVPPDYKEGPPSAFMAPSAKCVDDCLKTFKAHVQRRDETYYKLRP